MASWMALRAMEKPTEDVGDGNERGDAAELHAPGGGAPVFTRAFHFTPLPLPDCGSPFIGEAPRLIAHGSLPTRSHQHCPPGARENGGVAFPGAIGLAWDARFHGSEHRRIRAVADFRPVVPP